MPSTGSSAWYPGNRVSGVYQTHASRTAPSPSRPAASTTHRGARTVPRDMNTARPAPTPSSHVRVSVEKYAVVGDSYVAYTDHANDATLSAPISSSGVRRAQSDAAAMPASAMAPTSSSGQTR